MKTVGKVLSDARITSHKSVGDVSRETKIKVEFISAVEAQEWSELPDYGVVLGFVRSIAKAVCVDEEKAVALLRRDYPPRDIDINPKPDLEDSQRFFWKPKYTVILVGLIVSLVAFGYLFLQYRVSSNPPSLLVIEPLENQTISANILTVKGKTVPDTSVVVNDQPVVVDEKGNFETEIELLDGQQLIKIKARSRLGKETVVERKVTVKP